MMYQPTNFYMLSPCACSSSHPGWVWPVARQNRHLHRMATVRFDQILARADHRHTTSLTTFILLIIDQRIIWLDRDQARHYAGLKTQTRESRRGVWLRTNVVVAKTWTLEGF